MPDTLAGWLSYLESLHPKTIALGLERVAQVKQRLNLQPGFPIITVGGTNGKGSVCAMLEAMLHAAGYKVGCYTSPHLLDYNERVRIGKKQASDTELCASFENIEQVRGDTPLTYFEFGTLAAMQCFISHKVDVAILEVGLGGRLDAVNVFDSDCAVVTSVDIDHTDYLGDTRDLIAFEKAGIFRAGKVAIFGDRDMPEVIASEARRIGAELWRLGIEFGFQEIGPGTPNPAGVARPTVAVSSVGRATPDRVGIAQPVASNNVRQWNYHGSSGTRSALPFPALRGAYQLNNASAVLAVLDALKEKLPVNMDAARRGLVEVALPGRFQVLPGRPQIILDVAHNPHAAHALAQNLAEMPPSGKTFAVFAMLRDKDRAGVVQALKEQVDVWLVAGIAAPRGASADELAQVLAAQGVKGAVLTFATVTQALHHACNQASENDRIAAFGSFYTVAEAMHARGLRVA
ncbi:MAG: bifunctional tetrahydrofolate synthase/dihydrofolate synthase [Nitrosomonadales bacterium]|nr:bifunctional tetrahydrofolate synthase/dihydrofolate synthase [Nitrosomonadales bacterium]